MITLELNGKERKFSFAQAQNILHIQKQMKTKNGFILIDEKYEYKDNALIKRPSKRVSKKEA